MRLLSLLLLSSLVLLGCANPGPLHLTAKGALGPYSASVTSGSTVYVSGQIAPDPDFATETEGVIRKIEHELARVGCTLADLVSVTVYLTDIGLYGEFNQVYARVIPPPYPARACVGVGDLPGTARVEVKATAVKR